MKVDVMDIFTDESAGKELTEAELAERWRIERHPLPWSIASGGKITVCWKHISW